MTLALTGAGGTIQWPFSNQEIAQAVNRIPNTYGLLNTMGLFPTRGVASTLVRIDVQDGQVVVLESKPRGAEPGQAQRATDVARWVQLPSFPHQDTLTPDDLQDVLRVINGELRTESLAEAMQRIVMDPIRRKHDLTLEWLRIGALQGNVTDGAGAVLLNLFDYFGITKKSIDFVLGTDTTDIIGKCSELWDHMQENLKGETMTGPVVIVSKEWFNKFVQHPKVKEYYLSWEAAGNLAAGARVQSGGMYGRQFNFQSIQFVEYIGSAPLSSGASGRLVAAGKGYGFPDGTTQETHVTFAGPPYDITAVNQPGGPIHITQEVLPHGAGIEVRSESCPLPIWKRPEVLVEVTTSN